MCKKNNSAYNILKNHCFSLLIALVIWVVCMIPVPETPLSQISFIDKWTHFVMYATLTLTMLFEHSRGMAKGTINKEPLTTCYIRIVGIAILMGCLVELAQAYLTTCRSGEWFDALCNTLGSILGLGIFSFYIMFVQKKR